MTELLTFVVHILAASYGCFSARVAATALQLKKLVMCSLMQMGMKQVCMEMGACDCTMQRNNPDRRGMYKHSP